ncbi:hypothetical protein J2X29_001823 [Shewanella putrefaciens]|uniref:Uncharacterized protein n=1 Tax=Shewanella putrefaciens (strain 200) TaxID=399804 RepID=E6XL60_SHEP2|nr:hypothetical protein [Shewanella putrefaciens]
MLLIDINVLAFPNTTFLHTIPLFSKVPLITFSRLHSDTESYSYLKYSVATVTRQMS